MRLAVFVSAFVLGALILNTPASAQPAPTAAAAAAEPACVPRTIPLGAIGRAIVVPFTGAVFGENVCALAANVAFDGFGARFAEVPSGNATIVAAVQAGRGATVSVGDGFWLSVNASDTSGAPPPPNALPVGPFIVAPGGQLAVAGGDTSEAPSVILAFSGQRVLLIHMSAVTLVDAARILRDRPALFGADAIERAVIVARGPNADLQIVTRDGPIGSLGPGATRVLELAPR